VVKIRLQQQRGLALELLKYKGPIHCAISIVREEGLLGLWAGAAPTVMRNGINQAAMFTAKNSFDGFLWKKHDGDAGFSCHGSLCYRDFWQELLVLFARALSMS